MSEYEQIQAATYSLRIAIETMQAERLRLVPLATHYYCHHDLSTSLLAEELCAARRCDELTTAIAGLRALLQIAETGGRSLSVPCLVDNAIA